LIAEILKYFETIPTSHRSLILIGGITFFWIIENRFPFILLNYKKWSHAGINIFFTLTTIIVNFSLAFLLLECVTWVTKNNFGLLYWFSIESLWLKAFLGLLLMDFIGAYLPHYVQHKTKLLWRFHLIHHTDTWIDTTSANRHHPGESVIRFVFTVFAVIILGAPIWLFFLYQTLSVVATQFNHANIALPDKVDDMLSYFIVSPNMHKVHHHYVLPYTDSNYGNIFSIWDRLLGTFLVLPKDKIIYGVDTHMNAGEHNNLLNLIKIPFKEKK
jgi:sterol desaturase/sphingolipid hydroxylase (fatty acid hydroxylase superfamily)